MRKFGCFGLFVAAALAIGVLIFFRGWIGPGPAEKDIEVLIRPGSSLTAAAVQLEESGAIRSSEQFLNFTKLLGGDAPIHSGEYKVTQGMSARAVLEMLQSGKTLQRFMAIPEGMPSILVYEKLMAEPLLTGKISVPAEGSVLPDSYSFQRGETRSAVLKRMQAAMEKTLAELWAQRKPGTAVSTPEEAINLAAIVEKETGVPSERRRVASVYSNRLKMGMRLQADPTVIYPVTKGKPLGRRILRSELLTDNGYNTYVRAGLPDGPIANPGRESIAAVLDPEQTRYIYFVADGSGGHIFAETLDKHNANVRKWYDLRRERGEM